MTYNDFDNQVEEITKDICVRLNIHESDWRRYASVVANELVKRELLDVLKKDVLVECTTSELLKNDSGGSMSIKSLIREILVSKIEANIAARIKKYAEKDDEGIQISNPFTRLAKLKKKKEQKDKDNIQATPTWTTKQPTNGGEPPLL